MPGIQPAPSIANPFGPVFLPPGEIVVPEPMPAEQLPTPNRLPNASELAQKPGADFLWRNIPGLGIGWILPSPDFNWGKTATGWGWIKTKPEAAPVTVPTFPPTQALSEFPERGVEPSPPDMEKKFWCNGVRSTPEQIAARLNLTDDSTRWNLSVVGDPSFQRQVRDDVAALPVDIREKLHVQTYIPTGWEPAQFKLATGLNLRRPAVCRVGADLGTVAVTDYTPTKLAELMTVPSGPKPKPIQPPEPKPVPPNVEPTPAPTASTTNPIVFLAIAAVIVFLLVKGR